MLVLLFSSTHQLLGELVVQGDALVCISVSLRHDSKLADLIEAWQMKRLRVEDMLQRMDRHGYTTIKLPDRLLPQWQKLCQIPLEPTDRWVSLKALLNASHAVLQAWDRAMDKTIQVSAK